MLRWIDDPATWWYELRPHVVYGTLEVRVCDTQTTVREAAAIAAYVHALVAWLVERDEEPESRRVLADRARTGSRPPRHGLDASFADLATGERRPVRDILRERLDALQPVAERLGCAAELAGLSLEANGADRQREAGLDAAAGWLADRFLS